MAGRVLDFGFGEPARFQARSLALEAGGGYAFTLETKRLDGLPPGFLRNGAFAGELPAT